MHFFVPEPILWHSSETVGPPHTCFHHLRCFFVFSFLLVYFPFFFFFSFSPNKRSRTSWDPRPRLVSGSRRSQRWENPQRCSYLEPETHSVSSHYVGPEVLKHTFPSSSLQNHISNTLFPAAFQGASRTTKPLAAPPLLSSSPLVPPPPP